MNLEDEVPTPHHRRRALAGVLLVLASSLTSCSSGTAVLDLELRTSLVPGAEFDRVLVSVLRAGSSRSGSAIGEASGEYGATIGEPFVDGVRVAELGDLAPGEHVVRIQLTRPGGTVFVERWVAAHITGRTALRVRIDRGCVSVTCPGPADPTGASECAHGVCVEPTCNPDEPSSASSCPPTALCHADAECAPAAACAVGTCQGGYCRVAARTGACGAGTFCDPDRDCTALPGADAGVRDDAATQDDAAMRDDASIGVDAGTDAAPSIDAASVDGGSDAGHDAGSDGGTDAGQDGGRDAGHDDAGYHGCPGEGALCCVSGFESGITTCSGPSTSICSMMMPSAACLTPMVCVAGVCM